MSVRVRRHLYLATAVLIALMTSAHAAWCCSNGVAPGDDVFRLYGIVMMILVVSWLVAEPAFPAGQKPSFDYGMLMWAGFPFLASYHMYVAHRWRGILVVLGLIVLFFAPYLSFGIMQAVHAWSQ